MDADDQGIVHGLSAGGLAARHRLAPPFEFRVGPSTSGKFNTARLRLIPIACWRVENIRFQFDSSFVGPDITSELRILQELRNAHKKTDAAGKEAYPPLAIFGHADPVGPEDYNKALSGRRAAAIYALLICHAEPKKAGGLWKRIAQEEGWGAGHRQAMEAATGLNDQTSESALMEAYLQKLCPPELRLTPQDFLAQGADPGGKGDYQGCSSFNPLLIFSQAKEAQFDNNLTTAARNEANEINRRVVALLFRVGSKVDPGRWPCPRTTEGIAGCHKRFWSDGEARRSRRLPEQDRHFVETQDTFACRFFQRIADGSPCNSTNPRPICVAVYLDGLTAGEVALLVEEAGDTILRLDGSMGQQQGQLMVWTLQPEILPRPTELVLLARSERIYLGQPFEPCGLRDALQLHNLGPPAVKKQASAGIQVQADRSEGQSSFSRWDQRTIAG